MKKMNSKSSQSQKKEGKQTTTTSLSTDHNNQQKKKIKPFGNEKGQPNKTTTEVTWRPRKSNTL
jgi:hypothetical protein